MKTIIFEGKILKIGLIQIFSKLTKKAYHFRISPIKFLKIKNDKLPNENYVKVKNILSGICGSDMTFYTCKQGPSTAFLPMPCSDVTYLGHETVGEVVEVGSKVKNFKIGDRVCMRKYLASCELKGFLPEEFCPMCKMGNYSDCENYGDLKFVLVEINQAGILEMAMFGAAAGIVTSPFWSSPTTFVLNIENCNNFGNIETNPRTYDYVYETSSGQYRHSESTIAAGIYAGTSSYFEHGTGTGTNPSSIDVVNITDSNNFGDISTSCNMVAGIMFEYGYQCTARLLENCGSFGDIFVTSNNSYVSPLVLTQMLALGNVIISNCYVEASAILQEQQDADGQIVSSESSLVGALLLNPLDGMRNLELSNVQISFSINLENLTALSADAYVLNNSVGATPIEFGYIEGQTVASVSNVLVDLNYIFPDYFQPEEKNYSREWTDITICQSILIDVEFCKNQTREDVCKNYVHTNDQTQPFSTSDWFFDEKLNNGMPMLRSFYFLANNLTDQQDVLARLLELGFTPQA